MSPKTSSTSGSCFVIMPFGGHWDEYYAQVYSPAIVDAGIQPVRADEVFRAGSVLQDIVEFLSQCSVVLADITEARLPTRSPESPATTPSEVSASPQLSPAAG